MAKIQPTRRSISWALLSALCGVSCLLYFAALAGDLPLAAIVILLGGVAIFLWILIKGPDSGVSKGDIAVMSVVGLGVSAFALKWYGEYQFVAWDELSHWAHVARHIIADDALFDGSSQLMAKTYPPGTALIQYYFAKILGGGESSVLLAHVVLFVASLVAAAGALNSKPLLSLAAFVGLIALTYYLNYQLYEILVDHILGGLLGAISAILLTGTNPRRYFVLISILTLLPLVKHIGLFFAVVGLACLAVAVFFDYIEKQPSKFSGLLSLYLATSGVLISQLSWKAYGRSIGATADYQDYINTHNFIEFFFRPSTPKHLAIWAEFWTRMASWPILFIAGALALTLLYVYLLPAKARVRHSLILLVLAAGGVGLTCLLLLSYAYFFSEYEAVRLASLERYLGSYMLAYAIALVPALLFSLQDKFKPVVLQASWLVASIAIFAANAQARTAFFRPQDERTVYYKHLAGLRGELSDLASVVLKQAEKKDRVYFIDQNTNGYTFYLFRYVITPLASNKAGTDSWCWSLGRPYSKEDLWTCDLKIEDVLPHYDFLVLANADEKFWQRYGGAFKEQDRGQRRAVFRIEKQENGLSLKRVFP